MALEKEGIDFFYVQHFDRDFSSLEPQEFLQDFLAKNFDIKLLLLGYDFSFGFNKSGAFKEALEFGNTKGWPGRAISPG